MIDDMLPEITGEGVGIVIERTVPKTCAKCGHTPVVWVGRNEHHHVDHYDCAICNHRAYVRPGK